MSIMISVNVGFITNSSSVIHGYPAKVMEHPNVKSLMEAYGVAGGYVGSNLCSREKCESFLVTKQQKETVNREFRETEYHSDVSVPIVEDEVVVIYGDEYESITSVLCEVMQKVTEELNLNRTFCGEIH